MFVVEEIVSLDFRQPALWSNKVHALLVIILLISIGAVIYVLMISNSLMVFKSAKQTELNLKNIYLQDRTMAINIEAYQQQKQRAENILGTLLQQLPDESDIPDLLMSITQAGQTHQVRITQIKPAAVIKKEFYAIKAIEISAQGGFHQIAAFLSDITALPRIVFVEDVKLSRDPINQEMLIMQATTKTYHYVIQQGLPKESENREKGKQ